MPTKIVLPGGLVQVPAGGGGSPVTDPNVGYIRSDGDAGGTGSPTAPFATAQQAVTAGFTTLDLGVGSFGDITWGDATARTLRLRGRGTVTTLGTISTVGGALAVLDTGVQSVAITTLQTTATAPTASGSITLTNVLATNVISTGGAEAVSGNGSSAGAVTLNGVCRITNLEAAGGDTADGGASGGDGGNVTVNGPAVVVSTLAVAGGAGATPGADGTVEVKSCGVIPTPTPDAATVNGAIINGTFYATSYP